jgi:hypothetical protein
MSSRKDIRFFKCVVTPRTEEADRLRYVKVSTNNFIRARVIPLDTPVYLTKYEIRAINGLTEILPDNTKMSVPEIMRKYNVPEEVANSMARDGSMNNKIKKRKKYNVTIVDEAGRAEKELRKKIKEELEKRKKESKKDVEDYLKR